MDRAYYQLQEECCENMRLAIELAMHANYWPAMKQATDLIINDLVKQTMSLQTALKEAIKRQVDA